MNVRKNIILSAIVEKPYKIQELMGLIDTLNPNVVHAYISELRRDGFNIIYNTKTKQYTFNSEINNQEIQIIGKEEPIKIKVPVYDTVDIEEISRPKSKEDIILLISDFHVGAKTVSYDIREVPIRINNLIENCLDVLSLISNGVEIENIYLFFLGDIVNGEGVYPTQWYHSSATVTEQLREAVSGFSILVRILSEYCKKLVICGVRGNHGRTGRFNAEESNYDIFFYDLLHLACKDYAEFHITKDFYMFEEVRGYKYLLTHGDQIKMYQSIPHYGLVQSGMRWYGSLGPFDVMCVGHFHTIYTGCWNQFQYIMNGTALTDDSFALEKLKMHSVPKMVMFGVSDRRPITWMFHIDVARRG